MNYFELRGRQINIKFANVYPNSDWEAQPLGLIDSRVLTLHGIVLVTRSKETLVQLPYAYIEAEPVSGMGLWLKEADYKVLES